MKAAGDKADEGGYKPRVYSANAILAFSDSKSVPHLFRVYAPYGAKEQRKPPFRLSVGTGGFISNFVLKNVEERVFNVIELGWEDLTMREVEQFSAFLMLSVGRYDRNTSPEFEIWQLDSKEREPRKPSEVEIWGKVPSLKSWPFQQFLKTVLEKHPEQFKKWFETYIDEDLLTKMVALFMGQGFSQ